MILLVTYFPWDDASGGAFIMRSNLDLIGQEEVRWLSLSPPSGHMPVEKAHVKLESHAPPAYANFRLRLRTFWRGYYRMVWSRHMKSLLLRRVKELDPRVVWFVADFGLVPVLLRTLPELRGRRVHLSIHDDPEPTGRREQVSRAFMSDIRAFRAMLNDIDFTADAVSEELLEATVPAARRTALVTLPIDPAHCAPQLVMPSRAGVLTLGFSGNFFGDHEFNCLVEGLRLWSARTGREWRLRVFGNAGLSRLDPRVEARGFTRPEVVREELRKCDVLFLPCPVDSAEMMTSLPTKLISYTEAGRPIFAFAPEGSATSRIVRKAGIGLTLGIRDASQVAECLERLSGLDAETARAGREQLIAERFSRERIARDLAAVLAS